MTYVASVMYNSYRSGNELAVFVGNSLQDINDSFAKLQEEVNSVDSFQEVIYVNLVKLGDAGTICMNELVQTRQVCYITETRDI
jgi:hypothetical protein